jgi:putative hydrolase of the HAD superfamily
VKAVIFDLGGVAVRWNPACVSSEFARSAEEARLIRQQLMEHGDWGQFDRGILSEEELARRFQQRSGLALERIFEALQFIKDSLHLIDETAELMAELKGRGVRLFCLSNMSFAHYDYLSAKYSFFEHFEAELISARVGCIKPEAAIYELALKKFAVPAGNCLFVDDKLENIEAARTCGMQALHFQNSAACFAAIRHFVQS